MMAGQEDLASKETDEDQRVEEVEEEVKESKEPSDESANAFAYKMSRIAHHKILLHVAKHPWADVYGFILGAKVGSEVKLTDAIPLFHSPLFAPMLDISARLVTEYCNSKSTPNNTHIYGFYVANARNNNSVISTVVKKIGANLRIDNKASCLVTIDNAALATETSNPMKLFNGENWKQSSKFEIENLAKTASDLTTILANNAQRSLCDIEDWLEDTALDWRNTSIVT